MIDIIMINNPHIGLLILMGLYLNECFFIYSIGLILDSIKAISFGESPYFL